MAKRAKTDQDLVYWGPEEVAALGPQDIAAPDDAITPGAYRWQPPKDGDVGYWAPLLPQQMKPAPQAPSLEQAFADYLANGAQGARVQAWLADFNKTVEGKLV